MPKQPAIALTIAGSDSSGGAGIQADIKTFSALGVYGASVITSVTAQNSQGVQACQHLPADIIAKQLASVCQDLHIDAVKTGMLATEQTINLVCDAIVRFEIKNVVVDPVMVSSSGTRLLEKSAIQALKNRLFPLASLITPNLPEAAELLGESEDVCASDLHKTIERLGRLGAPIVLLKGGHIQGNHCHDLLLDDSGVLPLSHPRVDTRNTHGTGCTLSSAICAELAKGKPMRTAVETASDYLQAALLSARDFQIGSGHGPLHHFHRFHKY